MVVVVAFSTFTPLASVTSPVVLLTLSTLGFSWAVVVYNVTQVSFRQRLCPPRLLGRMNASVRFLVFGTMPLGGLLGGVLGTWLGIVPALWTTVAGQGLAACWVVFSPLIGLRELPDGEPEPAAEATGRP